MIPLHFKKWIILFVLASIPIKLWSQINAYSKEELDRMEMTIAYYLIQLNSIEAISAKFPQLAVSAQDALREWNNAFYNSVQAVDKDLLTLDSAAWIPKKDLMVIKYSRADYTRIKEADARSYIFEVNKRAVGKIETPVLETLLAFNPKYTKEPEKEFTERYVKDFFSKSTKTSQGLDLKIVVPQSWKGMPGDSKAGIIHKFVNRYGCGNVTLTLYATRTKTGSAAKNQGPDKNQMITGICAGNEVKDFNGKYIIDNCPAARLSVRKRGQGTHFRRNLRMGV
ncbi:MAG: hypothetical protein HC905_19090 [Bacteroidales bacterium]|nr:hypothetical protein [Bacteroidales bacterium]